MKITVGTAYRSKDPRPVGFGVVNDRLVLDIGAAHVRFKCVGTSKELETSLDYFTNWMSCERETTAAEKWSDFLKQSNNIPENAGTIVGKCVRRLPCGPWHRFDTLEIGHARPVKLVGNGRVLRMSWRTFSLTWTEGTESVAQTLLTRSRFGV